MSRLTSCLLATLLLASTAASLHGQAHTTASRRNSIDAFAGATFLVPDFGTTNDKGYMFGGVFTNHRRLFNIGLEGRYTSATGPEADENSFMGGLDFSRDFRRFTPYINFLVGHGNIHFDHPNVFGFTDYTHDDSTVYDIGGGVNYNVTRIFALKGDVQYQTWKLGKNQNRLTPFNTSVGIVYHIPTHSLRSHQQ